MCTKACWSSFKYISSRSYLTQLFLGLTQHCCLQIFSDSFFCRSYLPPSSYYKSYTKQFQIPLHPVFFISCLPLSYLEHTKHCFFQTVLTMVIFQYSFEKSSMSYLAPSRSYFTLSILHLARSFLDNTSPRFFQVILWTVKYKSYFLDPTYHRLYPTYPGYQVSLTLVFCRSNYVHPAFPSSFEILTQFLKRLDLLMGAHSWTYKRQG